MRHPDGTWFFDMARSNSVRQMGLRPIATTGRGLSKDPVDLVPDVTHELFEAYAIRVDLTPPIRCADGAAMQGPPPP